MRRPNQKRQITAYLLAAAGVILFSLKAIFVKMAYEYNIDTISLLLIRMTFSFPVYIIIAIVTTWKVGKEGIPKPSYVLYMIIFGILGYYLSSYLDFAGLQYVSASLERMILFVYPTIVVIISALAYQRSIPKKQLIAIMITYFGIFLAFSQNVIVSNQYSALRGGLLIFACAFTYACYLVGSDKLIPIFGSFRYTAYAMIIACLVIVIHYTSVDTKPITSYPHEVYWIGIGMAILSTILPSFMISEAIRRVGAPVVAIIGSIGPFATIVFERFFLHERISAFEGLGTIIVISGVLLITNSNTSEIENSTDEEKMAA